VLAVGLQIVVTRYESQQHIEEGICLADDVEEVPGKADK